MSLSWYQQVFQAQERRIRRKLSAADTRIEAKWNAIRPKETPLMLREVRDHAGQRWYYAEGEQPE